MLSEKGRIVSMQALQVTWFWSQPFPLTSVEQQNCGQSEDEWAGPPFISTRFIQKGRRPGLGKGHCWLSLFYKLLGMSVLTVGGDSDSTKTPLYKDECLPGIPSEPSVRFHAGTRCD